MPFMSSIYTLFYCIIFFWILAFFIAFRLQSYRILIGGIGKHFYFGGQNVPAEILRIFEESAFAFWMKYRLIYTNLQKTF